MIEGVIVEEADNGQRVDRWLKKYYPQLPFSQMQKILRTGQMRVDGKRAKPETRLATGQILRLPPQVVAPPPKEARGLSQKDTDFIQSLVIYKDDYFIAINKPSGLATQGGSKIGKHVDGMLDGLKFGNKDRPHLVHRLDKDTSGVLLLARSANAARQAGEVFRDRDIRKYYWAITSPAPLDHEGKIKSVIAKVEGAGGERMMAVDDDREDGKMALTYYSVMENLGGDVAWVAFWPRTGRTHQIRVHAAEIGAPLLGDFKYNRDQSFYEQNPELPQSLHLHARRLVFDNPFGRGKIDIVAPLGPEMRKTFKHFGFNPDDKSDPFADME